jgi:hypothetical protein
MLSDEGRHAIGFIPGRTMKGSELGGHMNFVHPPISSGEVVYRRKIIPSFGQFTPVGRVLPHSQFVSVETETPNLSANVLRFNWVWLLYSSRILGRRLV